jgi:hypothetical protein
MSVKARGQIDKWILSVAFIIRAIFGNVFG